MSMELANAGLQVLCLERGRMIDPQTDFVMPYVHDELKYDRHSDIFQNLSRETITFRNTMNETALPMREFGSFKPGEIVGGTALHWGCHARRFLPWDSRSQPTIERYGKGMSPKTAPARIGASPTTNWSRITTSSSICMASAARPAISRARSSPAATRSKARARASFQIRHR
jgi:hypothetical protein